MTADHSSVPPPAAAPDGRPGAWRSVAGDVANGASRSAPHLGHAAGRFGDGVVATLRVLKRAGARTGDWLANVGWGKFFLLALLLLVFGAIFSSVVLDQRDALVIEPPGGRERSSVSVSGSPQGIRVAPGPVPPPTPAAPRSGGATSPPEPPGQGPEVGIDERGVRILTQRDGKPVAVLIDRSGVRVTEEAARGAAADSGIVIAPDAAADPQQLAQALESVRDRVEEIVAEQIDREQARQSRVVREQSGGSPMALLLLLIVSAIIVKVVLGSKKKAEVRAQAASATAAEEGLKRQLAEAQLKTMQAQVEPHFLFNTLASVDYLIETDPARASSMQKHLIQYLRAALPQMREGSSSLGKELALCRSYLEILKVRMEDRLQFAIAVPQGLASAQFPPMMLQSLVENAIKHGLEPKSEGGTLTLSADIADGKLRVTVADTGLGFGAADTAGTGLGLTNVRERLAALYGSSARLSLQANTPGGTLATIEVPYVVEGGAVPGVPATSADPARPQPA
jgi:hypothetical protein